jgi:hypothetical protein
MNSAERCSRPERGGELSAWKKWLSPWQLLRWSPDMQLVSHYDENQRLSTWHATTTARWRWESLSEGGEQGRDTAASRSGFQLTGGEDLLPRDAIHPCRHESWRRWHESRRRESSAVRAAALAFWSQPGTVPWESSFSARDSQVLGQFFSKIFMVTYPNLCSKAVELQTSYNFVIATSVKFLINQAWIHARSLSGCTVYLNFSPYEPDSPTLGLIISNIFLTTILTLLSKVVLPCLVYKFDVVT